MTTTQGQFAAFLAVVWIGVYASLCLFGIYQTRTKRKKSASSLRWLRTLQFSVEDLAGSPTWQLALVSLLGLFLEMLVIRWVSSEIRIFAYFKNFVLIACFLGFGLGCYLCRRTLNLLPVLVPLALLALLIKLPWEPLRDVVNSLPHLLGASSEVHVWGVPSLPSDSSALSSLASAVLVMVPLFALIALIFVPIGQLVGWYMENSGNGIWSYSVNVLASLGGILLYTLLCFLYEPPAVWFLLAGLMLVALVWRAPRLRWAATAGLALCAGLVSLAPRDSSVYWSPYQKLTIRPRTHAGETIDYQLSTNDSWYQQILNLSPEFVRKHPRLFETVPIEWNSYNLPFHFYPDPPSVLVLGAGMGNDVAAALRNSTGSVVAVEIDPLIGSLGRKLHFEKPYDSPRVRLVIDDARSYVQSGRDRFDLIVFSLLDSHTTSSHYSNIRIDNYVYTIEALEATRKMLQPDGLLVVKFQVETPWIAGRLKGLLERVFHQTPVQLRVDQAHSTGGSFFIAGSRERIARALSNPALSDFVQKHKGFETESATLTTDDWPYFYQHEPGLPASVITISLVLAALCWLMMRQTGMTGQTFYWQFFFLGAGFLLLEAQIISKMALLFGTTWVVNSIVVSALMVLILASNLLVSRKPEVSAHYAYAGIFLSAMLAYWIPLERLFFASLWLKALVSLAVLCLPVFFAGIVFIQSFAKAGFRGEALGSNLLGALVGGLLESLSMWTGLKSLLVIAVLLYAASYFAFRYQRVGAASAVPAGAPVLE